MFLVGLASPEHRAHSRLCLCAKKLLHFDRECVYLLAPPCSGDRKVRNAVRIILYQPRLRETEG